MARLIILLMLSAMLLTSCDWIEDLSSGKGGGAVGGDKSAIWSDPQGDVRNKTFIAPKGVYKSELPALDVIEVKAAGKNGDIVLTTKIAGNFSQFFDFTDPGGLKHGGFLAEYFIDTDNNPATGAIPSEHDRGGYDVGVRVMLGYQTNKGRVAGGGNVDTNTSEIISNYATFSVRKMNKTLNNSAWLVTDPQITLGTDTVEVRVPYEWFGLKSGDTVRICFKEGYQSTVLGFSDDKNLKLK